MSTLRPITDCQGRPTWLYFNEIYMQANAEQKFQGIKPYIETFVKGGTSCIFNHGYTGSGKSFTMFGSDGNSGVLSFSVKYILESHAKTIEIFAIELIDKNLFDIINGTKVSIQKISDATLKEIRSVDNFNVIISSVLKARKQYSTNQNATSSRSHLMIGFGIVGESKAKMAFFDLAGWENPNEKNISETKFINGTLSEFNNVLIQVAKKRVATFTSPLGKLIKPYLSTKSDALMFYHVSNEAAKKGFENIKDVVVSGHASKRSHIPLQNITNKRAKNDI